MHSHSILTEAVASHPFVKGMRFSHIELLAQCAMFTEFERGAIIFRAGDIANRFYLIQRGKVAVEAGVEKNSVVTLQTLGAGDVLGWSWLFAPYYWQFSACAVEPTAALFFYGTRLRESCENDPEFGYELLKRVSAVVIRRLQSSVQASLRPNICRSQTRHQGSPGNPRKHLKKGTALNKVW